MKIEHIPGVHLIQETKDPLNKKFLCKQCGKLFRTRQGLSGHIQFKHGTKQNTLAIDVKDIAELKIILEAIEGILGLSKSKSQMINAILDNWINITSICDPFDIHLNKQDFKKYFVERIVGIFQS